MRVIETGRLVLRTWHDEDVAPFAEMNADEEVMEHFPATLSFEETMRFYNRITAGHDAFGHGLYAVELKGCGEFIGYTGFQRFDFGTGFSPYPSEKSRLEF